MPTELHQLTTCSSGNLRAVVKIGYTDSKAIVISKLHSAPDLLQLHGGTSEGTHIPLSGGATRTVAVQTRAVGRAPKSMTHKMPVWREGTMLKIFSSCPNLVSNAVHLL